jgi:serine/threonine protein kinase
MNATVNESRQCPNCGKPLPAGALAGLCPACLLAQGAETDGGEPRTTKRFEPPSVEAVAKLFPQLEVLGLLGAGGMGAVYKARQPALDRLVALKILPAAGAGGGNFAERFNREARALARLSHPNIVAVHEFGQVAGLSFFVMEFVDGANLRQFEQAGRLSPREALQIIPQICDALQYAHDEGVVHRDIKPENVLVDRKGRVKIADFGLAKILGREGESLRLTVEGQVMGTPHYMAPEQVERPLAVDHRADIYSLGVVFYEMLTGDLPIGKFPPPSRNVQVDVRLDDVVLRALEKEPERRYQQASQVRTDVEAIASSALPCLATSAGSTPGSASAAGQAGPSGAVPKASWPLHRLSVPALILTAVIAVLYLGARRWPTQRQPRLAVHDASTARADSTNQRPAVEIGRAVPSPPRTEAIAVNPSGTSGTTSGPPAVQLQVAARVQPGHEWIDTGVRVMRGELLMFEAAGRATHNREVGYSSANGNARVGLAKRWTALYGPALLEEAPLGALVGRIGTEGSPFLVGERLTLRAAQEGMLFLGFNDNLGHAADNDGVFTVRVGREDPAVAPRPQSMPYETNLTAFFKEVDQTYPFFDLKAIRGDWEQTKKQLTEKAKVCASEAGFMGLVIAALACLRDAHATVGNLKAPLPERPRRYYPGLGFLPATQGRVVVMWAATNYADRLKPGTVVTQIDGRDARAVLEEDARKAWCAENPFFVSSPQRARLFAYRIPLAGPQNVKHTLHYLAEGQEQEMRVVCDVEARGWSHTYNHPSNLVRAGSTLSYGKRPSGEGYMYLRYVRDETEAGMRQALQAVPDATGWIIDLRGNGGGGYDEKLIERLKTIPQPVVVLIDAGCASAGETLARDLARHAQARLLGSRTAGSSGSERTWAFPSGVASVTFSVRSHSRADGQPIEFNGILPDVEIEAVPEEVARGFNSEILRAEEHLRKVRGATSSP